MNRRSLLKLLPLAVTGLTVSSRAAGSSQNLTPIAQATASDTAIVGYSSINGGTRRPHIIENPNTRYCTVHHASCGLCPFVECLARQIMTETGEWKESIWNSRNGKVPMVITRHACCCCEVTLERNAHHPNWTYTMRPLTNTEKKSFHEEYGHTAPLLISMKLSDDFSIRGFILNGRKLGWNLSTETKGNV